MMGMKSYLAPLWSAAALWYDRDGDLLAATVSYYSLFAVVPLLFLSVSLSSFLFGRELVSSIFLEWGSVLGTDLLQLLTNAVTNLESLSSNYTIPIFGAVFFSSMTIVMFNTFTTGLHQLWGIPHQGFQGWIKKTAFSVLFIFIFEGYLLALLGFYQLTDFFGFPADSLSLRVADFFVSLLLTASLFSLMYRYLPWRYPPLWARLVGAFVASALFPLAKFLSRSTSDLLRFRGSLGRLGCCWPSSFGCTFRWQCSTSALRSRT